jgi:hypothetical protein
MWKRFSLLVFLALIAALPVLAGNLTTRPAAGSGFVISSDGYILTNYHVVEGATDIEVWLQDGRSTKATVVDYSPTWEDGGYDIALLRVSVSGLPALALGDSSVVGLYESVVAIGYPLGFELGVALNATGGHVSSFRRYSEELSLLQIDAAINHGNSGGPLLSEDGLVVGIVTAGITRLGDQDVQGVNFAVPINYARQLVERRGIALPQPTPANAGRAIQEVVQGATSSVVYIRSTLQIPVASLLPTEVPGYGTLSEPAVWTPQDERLARLAELLGHVADGSASREVTAEAAILVGALLDVMDPQTLCTLIAQKAAVPDCRALVELLAKAPRKAAIDAELDALLNPLGLKHGIETLDPPCIANPVGYFLPCPLGRTKTVPEACAWASATGNDGLYEAGFFVAMLDSEQEASSVAGLIPGEDTAAMFSIETGTLQAGTLSALYALGWSSTSWLVPGSLCSIACCLRGTVTFAVDDVVIAVSLRWSTSRPPVEGTQLTGFWFTAGCVQYGEVLAPASSRELLTCKDSFLDELRKLFAAQLEAVSVALGK